MLTTEADLGQWRTPQELFAERAAGTTALMPPTVAMLTDLAGFGMRRGGDGSASGSSPRSGSGPADFPGSRG